MALPECSNRIYFGVAIQSNVAFCRIFLYLSACAMWLYACGVPFLSLYFFLTLNLFIKLAVLSCECVTLRVYHVQFKYFIWHVRSLGTTSIHFFFFSFRFVSYLKCGFFVRCRFVIRYYMLALAVQFGSVDWIIDRNGH